MPDIASRCGFCAVKMSTWVDRTDHIAEHFKSGRTMADWQGDWGFDEEVLKMVESAVPPCKKPSSDVVCVKSSELTICYRFHRI
jgi:hypothetical protein